MLLVGQLQLRAEANPDVAAVLNALLDEALDAASRLVRAFHQRAPMRDEDQNEPR